MDNTILLVDDNRMFIEIEKEFLQFSKVNILTAKDGVEVLEVLKVKRPDLIFMDFEMPRMDGATCCQAIRSTPALANIPVVMVTAKGNEEDKDHCYSMGCEFFLTKPLDRDVFLNTARKFLPNIDRREKRISANFDALLQVKNEQVKCKLHDLSAGGAFLSTEYFGNLNSVIQISFVLPGGIKFESHGRFTWINRIEKNYPHGVGIKFALIPKDMRTALNDFVVSHKQ